MEIALSDRIPTYSGGLGVLAGDTVRAASDLKVPLVAVSLVHRKGYLNQHLDGSGHQTDEPVSWVVQDYLSEMPPKVSIRLEGKKVHIRAWRFIVEGEDSSSVPVFFLDTDLPENDKYHRTLTDRLYGGDHRYRLCQEAVLGIGGIRMLRALGYNNLTRYHMNEGHASLLTLELLREAAEASGRKTVTEDDVKTVKRHCIFTTHTPVEAGHDKFPLDWAAKLLGLGPDVMALKKLISHQEMLNMTYVGLNFSRYVNGVADRHGEISRLMFSGYKIDSITNGVHAGTWTAPAMQALFDRYIRGWRADNFSLRGAMNIPLDALWRAHIEAKGALIEHVNRIGACKMDPEVFTLGFARRAAPYKRAALLVSNTERLKQIADTAGGLQIIYAGKAHPKDELGKQTIERVHEAARALSGHVNVCYLENYEAELARLITTGVDVWINTPQPPLEASGTSGMKAALNGVPSLSVLDGWWVEGHIEGVTGWSVGDAERVGEGRDDWARDAESLYDKLERVVMPMYYEDREHFQEIMRLAIAINGSFFNAHRMLEQYVLKAYFP